MLGPLGIALALIGPPGEGGDQRVHIVWDAPAGCPSGDDVARRAERLLFAADADIDAEARVTADAEGFVLALRIGGRSQTFAARSCDALADVAALLTAVTADPVAAAAAIEVASPPAPVPGIVDVPVITAAPGMPRPLVEERSVGGVDRDRPARGERAAMGGPRRRARGITGRLGAHALGGIGELPSVDAGLGVDVGVERGRLAVELRGTWLFERTTPIPGFARARAGIAAANASIRGCGVFARRTLALVVCAGPELGAAIARARDVRNPHRNSGLWLAAVLGPALAWRPHARVDLRIGVDLLVALRRPRFALEDDADANVATGRGGLRAWVSVGVRLGGDARRGRGVRPAARGAPTRIVRSPRSIPPDAGTPLRKPS